MSRKHNAKHPERGRSNYKGRLAKRGLSKAPSMDTREHLAQVQNNRIKATGSPFPRGAEVAA